MTQPPVGGPTGPADHPPAQSSPPAAPADGHGSAGPPPSGYPAYQSPAGPPRKRGALLASVALVVVLLLCVGGGVAAFLTLRNTESGEGAQDPSVAVDDFLTAVYQERDAAKAAKLVCTAARDQDKIRAKVAEVEEYVSTHQSPRFRWDTPTVDNETGDRATVTTTVTVTTADEKIADQDLRFTVIRKTGWWVCEVA
ncbi:hypothetical protein KIF24_01155 [Micromonospora sp. Llam7]|uniref:Rv0361 family membrane protein n=1 Tax=Micromonospora tarapacensis TaxID=2835305 RepID=UPI001C833E57|nr:hypothetical protein [Micromonospora tarapacensis]MBX7264797.1 hypothetical protein [Micromonospora tarapacensis]